MSEPKPGGIVNHPWHILLVIVEVCIVAGLFSDRPMCGGLQSDWPRAKATVCTIRAALDSYAAHNGGRYPDSLQALATPDAQGRAYLSCTRFPRDPWHREYIYTRDPVNVATLGADGEPGGTGDDADIDYASIVNRR